MAACEEAGGALEDDEVGAPAALAPVITVASWNADCSEALAAYIATPPFATHGMWSAAQHTGVKRAIFLRSFRFAQRHVGVAGTSPHLQALSEVANSGNVMRIVLRFAMAQYCTPTRAERHAICTMCHTSNDTAGLALWLRCGVDPNTIDVDGDTLSKNKGTPLLFIAARQGHGDLIDALLWSGADVDLAKASDGATPLFTDGCTPLYVAAQNGHTAIVSKLLQHGADKSIRGWQNETPLEAAQRKNHVAIVALLA
jgi:hypothetical protein